MMNVIINLESVFAQFTTISEIKELANSICQQTKTAYEKRAKEIGASEQKPTEIALNVSAKGEKKTPTKAKAEEQLAKETSVSDKKTKGEIPQVKASSLTKEQIKKLGIKFTQYSEKAVFLSGETKSIKEDIKTIGGGHWNAARKGWFLKNENAKALAKEMHVRITKA